MRSILNILRGIWLLRHREVLGDLGHRRQARLLLDELARNGAGIRICSSVIVHGYRNGLFRIGNGAQIREGTILAFGDDSSGYGKIEIGERSWIGQYNNLRAGGGDIRIGKDCLISQFCSIVGANHARGRSMPIRVQGNDVSRCGVTIGNDVWLGSGVAIMPGVGIGDGAVIGANAVVTTDVPSFEVWAGAPARRVGERL